MFGEPKGEATQKTCVSSHSGYEEADVCSASLQMDLGEARGPSSTSAAWSRKASKVQGLCWEQGLSGGLMGVSDLPFVTSPGCP